MAYNPSRRNMEDELNIFEKGRQPQILGNGRLLQFFGKWKTTLIYGKRKTTSFFGKWKTTLKKFKKKMTWKYLFENRRQS